jgi:hypothetical protein
MSEPLPRRTVHGEALGVQQCNMHLIWYARPQVASPCPEGGRLVVSSLATNHARLSSKVSITHRNRHCPVGLCPDVGPAV